MSGGEVQTSQRVGVEFQVGLGMVNVGFYVASIGVVLVVLAAEFGVPVESLAWLGSLYGVALIVVAFAGPMLLRFGAHRFLAGSAVVLGVGSLLLAVVPGQFAAYAGVILQAFGTSGLLLVTPGLLNGPGAESKLTTVNGAASMVGIAAPLLFGAAQALGIGARLPMLLVVACMAVLTVLALRYPAAIVPNPTHAASGVQRYRRSLVLRRVLTQVSAVAVEFCFVVWGVARLVDTGLGMATAAIVGAAFPVGMAVGRIVGPALIARFPMVPVGSVVAAVGTLAVAATQNPAIVGVGQLVAGLGIATMYPITLARVMATPGLPPELGASLGALGSGVAVMLAPAGLAAIATVVDLRTAFLAPLPLLAIMLLLYRERQPKPGDALA